MTVFPSFTPLSRPKYLSVQFLIPYKMMSQHSKLATALFPKTPIFYNTRFTVNARMHAYHQRGGLFWCCFKWNIWQLFWKELLLQHWLVQQLHLPHWQSSAFIFYCCNFCFDYIVKFSLWWMEKSKNQKSCLIFFFFLYHLFYLK